MKFDKLLRALGPVIAVAMAAGLSACDGMNVSINGEKGTPLAELDMSGAPPQELVLLGPDEVRVTTGDKLAITVEGDEAVTKLLRFTLKDGTLGVLRDSEWKSGSGKAVVNVTMPAPREVTMAGSGLIKAAALAPDAEVQVIGSGEVSSEAVSGSTLKVTLPGSGNFRAAGNVGKLDLSILGSGSAELDAVKVESADITIAGSGSAAFASDGQVKAKIMGSGSVTVRGRAQCTVEAMGSGKLNCEPAASSAAPEAPAAPPAPPAPPSPKAG